MPDQPQTLGTFSRVRRASAVISAALLAGIAALHALWALGGAWSTAVGSSANPSLPFHSRLVTWGLVAALFAGAALILAGGGLLRVEVPRWLITADCVFVAVFAVLMFGASVGSGGNTGSWKRFVYVALSLLLLASTLAVAIPERRGSPAR